MGNWRDLFIVLVSNHAHPIAFASPTGISSSQHHELETFMATPTLAQPSQSQTVDFLPLKGTDHVEFYVGNARQAAYFYRAAFGMSLVAYAGPETGHRDCASYVLQQGKVRFVLTTALRSDSDIARHVHTHGDGVRAIALWVDDARQASIETTTRGPPSTPEPATFPDAHGTATTPSIATYAAT